MRQEYDKYTAEDMKVWRTLFERQIENLQGKACSDYLQCLEEMSGVLNADKIPNFEELNAWLLGQTGWQIEVVPGMIPVDEFFELLSQKKFCSSTWLRSWEQLDYLDEPDMFHDIFGHVPLLANPVFSEFVLEFAKMGKEAIGDEEKLIQLQRLYWFTIEFGLMRERGELKIYGAGIMSSFGESKTSIAEDMTHHAYDIQTILNKHFVNNEPQTEYFVINSLEQLYESILDLKRNSNLAEKMS
ncbi:phenylalanine 4-monooxygenase [Parvicella tangerina]|uniref:Phenylalanine-4-hydroxylase n=1 Tax=Parvicella tangerina TaxID=2829795 RepID=A0A916JMA5_9FLAO|nr:phenylalanine 4-monooxygenase [Parvicella tangerina]CAG5081390.1 Phenylalanine-4-hydroxylase [Parvicella tangerina]